MLYLPVAQPSMPQIATASRLTENELIVPKELFKKVELIFPLAEIDVSVFKLGIVSQLQIKHGRRKALLTSAISLSDEHFEQLCDHVA